jgi:hypothetical protein
MLLGKMHKAGPMDPHYYSNFIEPMRNCSNKIGAFSIKAIKNPDIKKAIKSFLENSSEELNVKIDYEKIKNAVSKGQLSPEEKQAIFKQLSESAKNHQQEQENNKNRNKNKSQDID